MDETKGELQEMYKTAGDGYKIWNLKNPTANLPIF